jgi:hypothetical protein
MYPTREARHHARLTGRPLPSRQPRGMPISMDTSKSGYRECYPPGTKNDQVQRINGKHQFGQDHFPATRSKLRLARQEISFTANVWLDNDLEVVLIFEYQI